ncbi:Predicted nucleotide-binding protein, sugar kinase/HSP70/actin superfamily [Thermodesulforhabdus norvegica]|uniref:Predicted nucleotide-binding protein, sugar kinase/HSP70/actin superfamily n=2 Tax=Thermodesulforhabdus norvegica TaxID=39841 RepID=A0A1I4S468_9BACT|nr:Predicted nucleotide-binding protein, sugar kinase/HSP70/actin superfamily [Thermodesulforhabdus norvegica]
MGDIVNYSVFSRFHSEVGKFNLKGKRLLIPDMAPFGARLLASCFRAFDVDAVVMETYRGLDLGKAYTSGKECFPCQITLGDILLHLKREKERLGSAFDPNRYVYFLPESDGPCRFGMYNKLQRLVLDSFPEFKNVRIAYLSTGDAYSTEGILPEEDASIFRKLAFVSTVAADVMDRITWRARPYESRKGSVDQLVREVLAHMEKVIEARGRELPFGEIFDLLGEAAREASNLVDRSIPRKPLIGIVGEIYLRTHPASNQGLIRKIEEYGGEVVDASLVEWISFVSYERLRKLGREIKHSWNIKALKKLKELARSWASLALEVAWQNLRQYQGYRRALTHLDIEPDHTVWRIERYLKRYDLFSFEIGTEAALSIGGAIAYVAEGFNGIVNVFPFTCMPSTICSAILKPILQRLRIPFIDLAYDGSVQPGRDMAIRTFIYQAQQHQKQQQKRHPG